MCMEEGEDVAAVGPRALRTAREGSGDGGGGHVSCCGGVAGEVLVARMGGTARGALQEPLLGVWQPLGD